MLLTNKTLSMFTWNKRTRNENMLNVSVYINTNTQLTGNMNDKCVIKTYYVIV